MEQNWTFEELEAIQIMMDKYKYSHADLQTIYNLYNRVFKTNEQISSCGKCNANKLKALKRFYEQQRTNQ